MEKTNSQVIDWINEASISSDEAVKVTNLCKLQEVLINNKDSQLLHIYLEEVLQFSLDRQAEVRKAVSGFIEEAG